MLNFRLGLGNLKKLLLICCPGVYLYILNLEQHHRSQSNNYLIVQIFKNSHLKDFSVEECFGQLVNDINSLITNGIDISLGKSYPVRFAQYRSILIRAWFLLHNIIGNFYKSETLWLEISLHFEVLSLSLIY